MKLKFRMIAAAVLMLLSVITASAGRGFAIIVDRKSYDHAKQELAAYANAIEQKQGLKVFTVIDRWGVPDSIRAELIRLHNMKNDPIEGAVFVGDIPVAMIRDAQYMTSAFKMDQERYERKKSSVPSDRYYDDFNLEFNYLGKDDDAPYFYYSLRSDSRQHLSPSIYTGRIRPTDAGGTSRYDKLRRYLKKATAEKIGYGTTNTLDNVFFFSGHGYISESVVARMDEKQALYEHFPWLKQQKNAIGYMDHGQENPIKFKLMNELMRPELDYAILHHHGDWNMQYMNGIKPAKNPMQAKEIIQSYGRAHVRRAKERNKSVDSMMVKIEKTFDIPQTWLDNTFDPAVCEKDSTDDANLDLHIEDFAKYGYKPNCRVVVIDACFCGSFHLDDCIADEYIFGDGRTVACIANTVNVLQDKWSDRFVGLLGLGMHVGDVARFSSYLESHVIGDPTFTFAPSVKGIDVNKLIADDNNSTWRKLLKAPGTLPDLRSLAIDRLCDKGLLSSAELLEIFRTSPDAIVRLEALVSLSEARDNNFISAIRLAVDDSNELVQRFGLRFLGKSGDESLIPSLMSICISNNTSERCNFNAMTALSFYSEDKLLAEFHRQFDSPDVCYVNKSQVGATIEKAIKSSAKKWLEEVDAICNPATTEKVLYRSIRTLRNYLPYYKVPQLLDFLQKTKNAEAQVMLLEALGWHTCSYMVPKISACAKAMSEDNALPEQVRDEALRTYNRLK